jgi:hypothetical protein
MKISAIVVALNESEFIQPCIKAVYPFVNRIKVQTNYDRSWSGELICPDETIKKILAITDEAGKISLHISRIPDEALARNWLMRSDGYTLDHKHESTTSSESKIRDFCEDSDYFWIIDADEIYDPETIPNILNYIELKKPNLLKIRGLNYFKSWNYQIFPSDNFFQPGFLKRGIIFQENRNISLPFSFLTRVIKNKYWAIRESSMRTIQKFIISLDYLPEEIAVFHHGAYVGNDKRIAKKIFSSVHYDERMKNWYEDVWKKWTPEYKNIHPLHPEVFKGVKYVPFSMLPSVIRNEEWPEGYLEKQINLQ